jgi:hypothetical protein
MDASALSQADDPRRVKGAFPERVPYARANEPLGSHAT